VSEDLPPYSFYRQRLHHFDRQRPAPLNHILDDSSASRGTHLTELNSEPVIRPTREDISNPFRGGHAEPDGWVKQRGMTDNAFNYPPTVRHARGGGVEVDDVVMSSFQSARHASEEDYSESDSEQREARVHARPRDVF